MTLNENSNSNNNLGRRSFIVSSIFFLIFLCLIVFINHIRIIDNYLLRLHNCALVSYSSYQPPDHQSSPNKEQPIIITTNSISNSSISTPDEKMRLLIGILTLPDQYPRRDFLRRVYGVQSNSIPSWAHVDVKFIFCNITKEDQIPLVTLELMTHNDIIILNCSENMDQGKTYTYFSTLPKLFTNTSYKYNYVMKTDDDTFIRVENLVRSLKPLPREDLYYGYVVPCRSMDSFRDYMSGMGYLVSWDIVEWIRESEIPKSHIFGPEDKVFGEWLKIGHKGKNRFNAKWMMYDYPIPHTQCTHELWPDTVAVHKLKTMQKWVHTLNYFNITNPADI